MGEIHILDSVTIDKIAAGEVVERPSSVVKELVENSIDAGADMITVEIKDGGISMIRITDNGSGIEKSEIEKAFMRHATSKITDSSDLAYVTSLGFRGEALSSICAVCQVEMITKTKADFTGLRVCCNGGVMQKPEEIGAPDGTTMIVRNIFYNTPVRQKFLKSKMTEGSYISDLMQHLALSRPDIAFKFIQNGQTKFYTSGNGDVKEIIYRIYGKDTAENIIFMEEETEGIKLLAYLGKPVLNRSTRAFETFFVNGRYIKSNLISTILEEGYKNHLMQHKFPFAVLYFTIDTGKIDVNVHPTKMDIRINEPESFCMTIKDWIKDALLQKELIPEVKEEVVMKQAEKNQLERELTKYVPEPFEKERVNELKIKETPFFEESEEEATETIKQDLHENWNSDSERKSEVSISQEQELITEKPVQMELSFDKFFDDSVKGRYQIIGQIFDTYWMFTYQDKLYIMDQHAAHEKVMYEKFVKQMREHTLETQNLYPPVILSLSGKEQDVFFAYQEQFEEMGFLLEEFGGNEFALRKVPLNLYGYDEKNLFLSVLDSLLESGIKGNNQLILEKIASMSCKAAVKGNQTLSYKEAQTLIETLFTLENPYNCPHGRPTIISMSRYEIEKKFKRIV